MAPPLPPSPAMIPQRLRSALQKAVGRLGNPRSRQALALLLMRELGRKSVRRDLAKPPAAGQLKLDALQAFLAPTNVTTDALKQLLVNTLTFTPLQTRSGAPTRTASLR